MKVGDLVESGLKHRHAPQTPGIVIRLGVYTTDSVLVFWPGEEPVWEWRRNLSILREQA